MEYKDCIGNTEPSDLFSPDFLSNPLFELLPEGYDICYEAIHQYDMIMIHFYLYDSTVPLDKITPEDVMSYIDIQFSTPYKWSSTWTPLYNNTVHIPELYTNSDFEGFDLSGAGVGTFMILCVMAYSKSKNLHFALLYDASSGYRTKDNIYTKIGFKYLNDTTHEMIGRVDEIYKNIISFIDTKRGKFTTKLNKLTEYFDDEEWVPEGEDEMDVVDDVDDVDESDKPAEKKKSGKKKEKKKKKKKKKQGTKKKEEMNTKKKKKRGTKKKEETKKKKKKKK